MFLNKSRKNAIIKDFEIALNNFNKNINEHFVNDGWPIGAKWDIDDLLLSFAKSKSFATAIKAALPRNVLMSNKSGEPMLRKRRRK